MAAQSQTFTAIIQDAGRGGAYVTVPFDVEQVFGKKRVKVKATLDGEPYRGSLAPMSGPCHILGVLKSIRQKIGKDVGDEVLVTVEEDSEPRVVQVPPDLKQALASSPEAEALFERLSYTHQREYVNWVEEARREQTRQERVARVVELLRQGKAPR
ncbi:MAG TPA: YdeI/OmpD-associated family protein [Anaerolineae bacterium]|nr:YdeI/OmpD-associated family protein [Anaerolineae bacterium]HOQ97977.1 YdeI/OmpD-associated family protein [Anaerolineae bacterium]HPL27483.1 YdeI/OmpD-associated family protein [Anaerolineae bacterium]